MTTRGNTEQCLAHLEKAIAGRSFHEKRMMIADFSDVTDAAVSRWFRQQKMPLGEALIRLRFYLEHQGYEVAELEILPDLVRDAARLFAFRIASLSEIAELVGYGGSSRTAIDTLLAVFRGKQGVSEQKLGQFDSFVELYGTELNQKKLAVPKILHVVHGDVQLPDVATTQTPSHEVKGNQSAIIESFAGLITAMLPLAEHVLSDSFTAGQRARIRELATDGKDVSRLSNLLTQLSGEAVRTALNNSRKKEAVQ